MKKLIRFLWTGQWKMADPCQHEWNIIAVYDTEFFGLDLGKAYDLRCCKCGDIKRFEP